MVQKYIGARYVPKFSDVNGGDWDNSYAYEALIVVKHGNDFYTSKIPVPVGADINDTTYWALTGDYNGAIAAVSERVDTLEADYAQSDKKLRAKMLCHRGFTRYSPFARDNSIFALIEAAENGFMGCEVDPRKDANGTIVLLHDATVDSVSMQSGAIASLTYSSVFYKSKAGTNTGIHLTTLEEAVLLAKTYNLFFLFDMTKNVVSAAEIVEECEKAEYYNYGMFGLQHNEDFATVPDYVVKLVETADYTYTQADIDAFKAVTNNAKNLGVRIMYPSTQAQIELIKDDNDLLICANYSPSGTIGSAVGHDISKIDFMLGDENVVEVPSTYDIGCVSVAADLNIEDYVDSLPPQTHCVVQILAGAYTPTNNNYVCMIEKFSANYARIRATGFQPNQEDFYNKMKIGGVWGAWNLEAPKTKLLIDEIESTYNVNLQAYYKGGMVTVNALRENNHVAGTGWSILGTIPAGYRPYKNIEAFFVSGGSTIPFRIVASDGTIQIYNMPNDQIACNLTYPVA